MAKRQGAAKRWVFTFNGDATRISNAIGTLHAIDGHGPIDYMGWQIELGSEGGRLHIQGFFTLRTRQRQTGALSALGLPGPHIEVMRGGLTDSEAYCSKEDTRANEEQLLPLRELGYGGSAGPFLVGVRPSDTGPGRTLAFTQAIIEGTDDTTLIQTHPDLVLRFGKHMDALKQRLLKEKAKQIREIEFLIFNGPTGSGKSHAAHTEYGDVFVVPPPRHKGGMWFTGYEGEPTIVLDDFRSDWCSYAFLLRITDKWPLQVETKGGFVHALWTRVIITTTHPWGTWYPAAETATGELARRITLVRDFGEPRSDGLVADTTRPPEVVPQEGVILAPSSVPVDTFVKDDTSASPDLAEAMAAVDRFRMSSPTLGRADFGGGMWATGGDTWDGGWTWKPTKY